MNTRLSAIVPLLLATSLFAADPVKVTFTPAAIDGKITAEKLKSLAPDLPADWSDSNFLVIEWRASSAERFQLELFANDGPNNREVMVAKRINPFQNAWVRASIPLDYFRRPARDGSDLAATYNKPRSSYSMNINFGGWAPIQKVTAIGFQMDGPIPVDGQPPTIEIRSVKLAKTDPGDEVLEPAKLVDQFGQWIPADWPGKAKTLDDLKKAWAAEDAALKPGDFGYDKFGGYANTSAKATGFFRVEQQNGKWWFVDPDGHLFYSNGLNGVGGGGGANIANRQSIFEALPTGGGGRGGGGGGNFYGANLQQRFGQNVQQASGQLTFRRLDAWGFNTIAGFGSSPPNSITLNGQRKPYTIMLRDNTGPAVMGMPDVYAPDFAQRAEQIATACDALKDDPCLLGYFVGNEPPWPTRESMLCDMILAGADTPMKAALQAFLKDGAGGGDTPARRKQFSYDTFDKYLSTIVAAVKKHDPNHLTLGIRLGGEVPDEVYKSAHIFDVCSINIYDFTIDPKLLDKIATLTGRPLLDGEFHIGSPGRGMSGGLRQVASQKDRGLAYASYVEHAAAHPNVIGTHWFQWIDQPSTGRNDGENYNIGLIDVTDQPYTDLINAMAATHKRLYDVHAGKIPPTTQELAGKSTAEIQLKNPTMIPPPK